MSNLDDVQLSAELLEALDAFDQRIGPLGLYACEEAGEGQPFPRLQQEWKNGLTPTLTRLGCRPGRADLRNGEFRFDLPDGEAARLYIVCTSKIKVRKYGSGYRIDPHHDYRERWKELRLDRVISRLWRPSTLEEESHVRLRLCLFIGFASETPPFHKELAPLQCQGDYRAVNYQTRFWADRYERHFQVRLSVWSRLSF